MNTQESSFPRQGFWWRTMGFTKCHLIGVFVTETLLGILGMASIMGAGLCATMQIDRGVSVYLFLTAVCLFLAQIGVLLSSILSLLFYAGSRSQPMTHDGEESSQPAGGAYVAPAAGATSAHP